MHAARILLALASTLPLSVTMAAESVPTRYERHAGDQIRYQISTQLSMAGYSAKTTRYLTQTVREVRSNGDAVIEFRDDGGTVQIGTVTRDIPAGPAAKRVVSDRGLVLSIEKDNASADASLLSPEIVTAAAAAESIVLSAHAPAEHETWRSTYDVQPVGVSIDVSTEYLGLEQVGQASLAKFRQTLTTKSGATLVSTAWLSLMDGVVQKRESQLTNATTQLGSISVTMEEARWGE